jgi:hypothetical protein
MITRSFVYTISESNGRGVVAISNQVQDLNFKGSLEDALSPSPLVTYPPNPNTHCNHSIRNLLSNLIMKCVCLSKINTSIQVTTSHVITLIAIIGFFNLFLHVSSMPSSKLTKKCKHHQDLAIVKAHKNHKYFLLFVTIAERQKYHWVIT